MKKLIVISMLIFMIISTVSYAADRVSLGFLYGSDDQAELVQRTNGAINQVSPTWFDISSKGNLVISSAVDEDFIQMMKEMDVKITPFLSNHWSRSKGRAALKNSEKLSQQIVDAIMKYDLEGVNVDIENLTSKDRDDFSDFVNILRDKLPKDKMLTVSVAANPYGVDTGWQGSYDYEKLGEYADYLFVMAYDEHSQGGMCGPVASIDFVENSIKYALEKVSKDKIVVGIPLYGRFWGGDGERDGEAVVIGDVPRLTSRFKGIVEYDEYVKQPCVKFKIAENAVSARVNGKELAPGKYTIWYENKESIVAKLDLVNEYDLLGAGVWALGQEKVEVWDYYYEELNRIPYKEEEVVTKEEIYQSFMVGKEKERLSLARDFTKVNLKRNVDYKEVITNKNVENRKVTSKHSNIVYMAIMGKVVIKDKKITNSKEVNNKRDYLGLKII
ncbi:MAG: glycoside hydrolase [Clostridia bacterium]|nr:glycoside hydrolase [Clostridia bacterium]